MNDLISRQAAINLVEGLESAWLKGEIDLLYPKVVKGLIGLPSAQPEITDGQAVEHLQASGWMQNHDKQMYEMGLRERLADDSDSYDALLPSAQTDTDRIYAELSKAYNVKGLPDEAIGIIGDLMLSLDEPSAHPEQDREFMKLTVRNSNGRPYYSIIYLEFDDNGVGHDLEGYFSYSLDVISDYMKKYFMPSAQPERKTGKWIRDPKSNRWRCSKCYAFALRTDHREECLSDYCSCCGAYMKGDPND